MASTAKRFKATCINDVYHKAYSNKFRWNEILEHDLSEFFAMFAQCYNCPITIAMGSVLPLIACLCGPECSMEVRGSTYRVPLNTYSIIVSAPGGGKSVSFDKIVSPTARLIEEKHQVKIMIESYSSAGLQRHQTENAGRAILTSDEGHRLLAAINSKQMRQEAERALLNKLWGGVGDSTVLLGEDRGFKRTAFSMAILIQPSPLMSEMIHLGGEDGFMDRLLFLTDRPRLNKATTMRQASLKLQQDYGEDFFPQVLLDIFNVHVNQQTVYKFDSPAQEYYDSMCDEQAVEFNAMYPSSGKFHEVFHALICAMYLATDD